MRFATVLAAAALLTLSATTNAGVTFSFESDPFAGSTALTTPGRQVVGGEPSINFVIASDVFAFAPAVFGVADQVLFANDVAANLPTSGINIIVLRSFDNDANPATPFGAGNAANLIAAQLTSPGPGFFIYFNQGLDLARLVFSTDLDDNTADLKILARMVNLAGQPGRDAFPTFTEANFDMIAAVPEPSSLLLMVAGALAVFGFGRRRLR
jgi:hypothetical protein